MNAADVKGLDIAPEPAQNPDRFLDAVTHKPPFFQIRGKPDGMFSLHQEVERAPLDAVNRHAYGIRTDVDDRVQHDIPPSGSPRLYDKEKWFATVPVVRNNTDTRNKKNCRKDAYHLCANSFCTLLFFLRYCARHGVDRRLGILREAVHPEHGRQRLAREPVGGA